MSLASDLPLIGAGDPVVQGGARWSDRIIALILLPPVLLFLAVICPVLLMVQGRPLFYVSERVTSPGRTFGLLKLRTMSAGHQGVETVLSGAEQARVTPLGRVLRAIRFDEIPQIFNILRGDLNFVGPRPPLRRYVDAFPDLYREVLEQTPGITGLATVRFHRQEARILKACRTTEDADLAYRRVCVRAKARLDRFYRRKRSLGLDLLILYWTFSRLLPRPLPRWPHTRPRTAASHSATDPSTV